MEKYIKDAMLVLLILILGWFFVTYNSTKEKIGYRIIDLEGVRLELEEAQFENMEFKSEEKLLLEEAFFNLFISPKKESTWKSDLKLNFENNNGEKYSLNFKTQYFDRYFVKYFPLFQYKKVKLNVGKYPDIENTYEFELFNLENEDIFLSPLNEEFKNFLQSYYYKEISFSEQWESIYDLKPLYKNILKLLSERLVLRDKEFKGALLNFQENWGEERGNYRTNPWKFWKGDYPHENEDNLYNKTLFWKEFTSFLLYRSLIDVNAEEDKDMTFFVFRYEFLPLILNSDSFYEVEKFAEGKYRIVLRFDIFSERLNKWFAQEGESIDPRLQKFYIDLFDSLWNEMDMLIFVDIDSNKNITNLTFKWNLKYDFMKQYLFPRNEEFILKNKLLNFLNKLEINNLDFHFIMEPKKSEAIEKKYIDYLYDEFQLTRDDERIEESSIPFEEIIQNIVKREIFKSLSIN